MNHTTHPDHEHTHDEACSHLRIEHDGHIDYVHDGHFDEHHLAVSPAHPDACTVDHACAGHARGHEHGEACDHVAIPHGDHVDYLVAGHLHHSHDGHCDDHGVVVEEKSASLEEFASYAVHRAALDVFDAATFTTDGMVVAYIMMLRSANEPSGRAAVEGRARVGAR